MSGYKGVCGDNIEMPVHATQISILHVWPNIIHDSHDQIPWSGVQSYDGMFSKGN